LFSIEAIIRRLQKGFKARAQFVASHIDKGIANQIRALRNRHGLSQEQLAEMVEMNQNAISRLESPKRGRPTITTLKRLAEAFDVALVVRFVPFSQLARWVSGTPFIDEGISTASLGVPNFDEELRDGVFETRATTPVPEIIPGGQVVFDTVKTNTTLSVCSVYTGVWTQEEQQPFYTLRTVGLGASAAGLRGLYFANDVPEHSDQFNLFGEVLPKAERMPQEDSFSFGARMTTGQTELIH
jgi:transcriptional regulator with XRE-family HTH domain